MSVDDLERQVSAGLHDLVEGPVTSSPMFDGVADRVRRRRRRRLAGVAAAAVIVVVAAGVVANGGLLRHKGGGDEAAGSVVAPSCPAKDSGRVSNSRSDLGGNLVLGRPAIATICRYYGFDQPAPAGTLARSATVRDAAVASLAGALDGGQLIPPGARYNCPGRSSGSIRVIFGYRGGDAVTVRVDAGGCRIVWNGETTRFTSELARQQLTDLVGADFS